MKSNEGIPPLIQNMVLELFDPNSPEHIRYNYKLTLSNIKEYCDEAIKTYDKRMAVSVPAKNVKRKR